MVGANERNVMDIKGKVSRQSTVIHMGLFIVCTAATCFRIWALIDTRYLINDLKSADLDGQDETIAERGLYILRNILRPMQITSTVLLGLACFGKSIAHLCIKYFGIGLFGMDVKAMGMNHSVTQALYMVLYLPGVALSMLVASVLLSQIHFKDQWMALDLAGTPHRGNDAFDVFIQKGGWCLPLFTAVEFALFLVCHFGASSNKDPDLIDVISEVASDIEKGGRKTTASTLRMKRK